MDKCNEIPLFSESISAGFPSPAEEDETLGLDLNRFLIKNRAATFFLRVCGTSMIDAGIHDNDILIVDKSIEPVHGKIVIAAINGELTVKRLIRTGNTISLVAENPAFPPIIITKEADLRIWGVVTNVIHPV